jgi:hypothetical protein
MKLLLIDNVNNLSGAPIVARSVAAFLGAPIDCIREEGTPAYVSRYRGSRSESRRHYISGVGRLLLRRGFVQAMWKARIVVCNTALTFPFLLLAKLLKKKLSAFCMRVHSRTSSIE